MLAVIIILLLVVIGLQIATFRQPKPAPIEKEVATTTDQYWDGPVPTAEEKAKNQQFIFEYLYKYRDPNSVLRKEYPHLADAADALHEYERIESLYRAGKMDEIDYNLQMEKLLPKINITQDF